MEDANIASLEDFQKHVYLFGDEMHIKEDLVYHKTSGELHSGVCEPWECQ